MVKKAVMQVYITAYKMVNKSGKLNDYPQSVTAILKPGLIAVFNSRCSLPL